MGCLKLTYEYEREGLEKSTFYFRDGLEEKSESQNFCTNYTPFGAVAKQWNSTDQTQQEPYRYGYQGQYAEEDTVTGWNSFELRMYDPVIGRWLQVDPYGQYASSYLGMGNNPTNSVDPDGGYVPNVVDSWSFLQDSHLWSNVFAVTGVDQSPTSLVGMSEAALAGNEAATIAGVMYLSKEVDAKFVRKLLRNKKGGLMFTPGPNGFEYTGHIVMEGDEAKKFIKSAKLHGVDVTTTSKIAQQGVVSKLGWVFSIGTIAYEGLMTVHDMKGQTLTEQVSLGKQYLGSTAINLASAANPVVGGAVLFGSVMDIKHQQNQEYAKTHSYFGYHDVGLAYYLFTK